MPKTGHNYTEDRVQAAWRQGNGLGDPSLFLPRIDTHNSAHLGALGEPGLGSPNLLST